MVMLLVRAVATIVVASFVPIITVAELIEGLDIFTNKHSSRALTKLDFILFDFWSNVSYSFQD